MEGINENDRREVGVNLTGGKTNAVEICEKILSAPSLDELLASFKAERGLGVVDPAPQYIEVQETQRKRIEEEDVMDDAILED